MDDKPQALKEALQKLKQLASGRLGDVTQAKVVESFNQIMAAREEMPPPPPEQMAKLTEQVQYLLERRRVQAQAAAAAGLDRKPTDQRNGRRVSTKALDDKTLRSASVETLIERFGDLGTALHESQETMDSGRTNRLQKRLKAIVDALQARVPDARPALPPLLADRNPGVRYYAAYACLPFAPMEADRALESLTSDSAGDLGSHAQFGLRIRRGAFDKERK